MKNFFVHSRAICDSQHIGARTRIYAFVHILSGAKIGTDCNICDHVFIEGDVVVGNRVTVKSGVQLWDNIRIEDDVFIGPNVTFTNDSFPRSRQRPDRFLRTTVKNGASIGANATILPGIEIGSFAMIGAGTVLTRSVPNFSVVYGNPGRVVGFVDTQATDSSDNSVYLSDSSSLRSTGCGRLVKLSRHQDSRGVLLVGEFESDVPFSVKRFFMATNVPSRELRGEHAHKLCHQFLICLNGSVSVVVDNGSNRFEYKLDSPEVGLYAPPMLWLNQHNFSKDACLLVFASDLYDPLDYIRDYNEFKNMLCYGTSEKLA